MGKLMETEKRKMSEWKSWKSGNWRNRRIGDRDEKGETGVKTHPSRSGGSAKSILEGKKGGKTGPQPKRIPAIPPIPAQYTRFPAGKRFY